MKISQIFTIIMSVIVLITACNPEAKTEASSESINQIVEPKTEQVNLSNYSKVIYVRNNGKE